MKIIKKKLICLISVVILLSTSIWVSGNNERGEGGEILWIYDADLFVKHIASSDLNNDGIDDVIASEYDNAGYDDISKIYAIDGSNGQTIWSYTINSGARSMTIGDINNDGIMDTIIGASLGGTTPDGRVHAIDGSDGSSIWIFNPGSSADTIGDVEIGDFNGDVYLDVAVACWDDFVYAVDGASGVELWNYEIDSIFVNAVSTGDVNGDGFDDVSYAHEYLPGYDNEIGVLDGTNGAVIWSQIISSTAEDTLMVDIDDDGDNESIFGVVKDNDEVEFQVRDGLTGSLEWASIIGQGPGSINPNIFLFTYDIDQDSDLDLIVGNEYVDFVIRAYDGHMDEVMWQSELLNGYPRHMSFADVNGNGYINIIAATYDRVQVLNATNGLKDWYQSVAGTIRGTAAGDFNDDGVMDVACSGGAEFNGDDPAKAVWALKTIQVSPVLWETNIGEYGNAVALGDFTGNSVFDVIGVTSNHEAYALNGTTGALLWQWMGTENLYTVASGDFNGDGIDDAAVAGADDIVTALDGIDGSLLWQFTSATNQYYRKTLATADLNTDGKIDVIAGNDNSYVYAINGETGIPLWSIDLDGSVRDIDLFQMDDWGVVDVVASAGNQITVINGSNGNLLWSFSTGVSSAKNTVVLDGNDDGIMDVVWGNLNKIELINGDIQTVIWSKTIRVNSDYSMATGDVDNDSIADVIFGGGSGSSSVFALNGIDGNTIWEFPTGGGINCVITSDVNDDGNLEVVVGSDDQHVYVLKDQGDEIWSYSTADDVMQIAIDDITGDMNPNIVAITFGSDGVLYGFRTLAENINNPPIADFTYSPTSPTTADVVQFTDLSVDIDGSIVSWSWDFGDGNTSTLQHPSHQFNIHGDYQVILEVMDDRGETSPKTTTITILRTGPFADFSYTPVHPLPDDLVQFNDLSYDNSGDSIVSWSWDFGDGNTSTIQHPSNTYTQNGSYLVNLTVMNTTGVSDTKLKIISVGLLGVDITLNVGWNMITVPIENDWYASDLASNITGSLSVSRWDSMNQTYQTFIVGGPPVFDFPIQDGSGYFVDTSTSGIFSLSGNPIDIVSIPLLVGWNLLGWFHADDTTASSLSVNITGCLSVSKWDSVNQTYQTFIVGGPPVFDFNVVCGMGLFVDVDTESTWFGGR